jgi:hypothetical protein
MALTKSAGVFVDWTAVAQNDVFLVGASSAYSLDWSDAYSGQIIIQAFLHTDNVAHTGTEFLVMGRASASDTNDDWYEICRFVDLVATNQDVEVSEVVAIDEAGGSATVAEDTTGATLFPSGTTDSPLKWGGFVDDVTIGDSEVVLVDHADADEVFLVPSNHAGTEYLQVEKSADSSINTTAMSRSVSLDEKHITLRVIVNNSYDVNGCAMKVRVLYTKVTAL